MRIYWKKIFLTVFNLFFSALVVGIYDESLQPGQAAIVVEKMAEYLSSQNY